MLNATLNIETLAQLRRFDPPFRDFRRASDWAARGAAGPEAENRL
jgi:hypothetical protein